MHALHFTKTVREQDDIIVKEPHQVRANSAQRDVPLMCESSQRSRDTEVQTLRSRECICDTIPNDAFGAVIVAGVDNDQMRRAWLLRFERLEESVQFEGPSDGADHYGDAGRQHAVPCRDRAQRLPVLSMAKPGPDGWGPIRVVTITVEGAWRPQGELCHALPHDSRRVRCCINSSMILPHANTLLARALPAVPRRSRRLLSAIRRSSWWASCVGLPMSATRAVSFSTTTARTPLARVVTTGSPLAIASATTIPNPSRCVGNTNTSLAWK